MKRKGYAVFICLFLAISFSLSSCARLKSAVGTDRLQNADAAILPEEKSGDAPHAESQIVSMGDETDVAVDNSELHQIGEPFLCDYNVYSGEEARPVMQYTVTDMHVYHDLDAIGKENILMEQYYSNGEWVTPSVDDCLDENGQLLPEYLFVLIDVKVKYVSGPEDETEHLHNSGMRYKSFPAKKVEHITTVGDEKFINYDYFDEDGNPWIPPATIGDYWSEYTDTGSKEDGYFSLSLGQETTWQQGVIVEKSLLLKYGICLENVLAMDTAEIVDLPVDLSEYE